MFLAVLGVAGILLWHHGRITTELLMSCVLGLLLALCVDLIIRAHMKR